MAAKKTGAEGAGGGKNKTILFLVIGVLVGAVVAFGVSKVIFGKSAPAKEEEKKLPEHAVELDEFIVNLADGSHYAKVSIVLGLKKPLGGEGGKLDAKVVAPVRDTIISVLSSKRLNDLVSNEGKEQLKKEIRERLNQLLDDEVIKEVYFTSLTLQ